MKKVFEKKSRFIKLLNHIHFDIMLCRHEYFVTYQAIIVAFGTSCRLSIIRSYPKFGGQSREVAVVVPDATDVVGLNPAGILWCSIGAILSSYRLRLIYS
jgi:hypothetical protein